MIWLAIWSRIPPKLHGDYLVSDLSQRPAYVIIRKMIGEYYSIVVLRQIGPILVAETLDGPRVIDHRNSPFPNHNRQILSYGELWGKPNSSEAYGLLAPVVCRHSAWYSLRSRHPEVPLINYDKSLQIAHEAGRIKYLPLNGWRFSWLAAVHDSLFLLTLIAWLISLIGIPHWIIWKRLTKAQRRRAKHQCPVCDYDLAGLTSSTCPECGNALSTSLITPK